MDESPDPAPGSSRKHGIAHSAPLSRVPSYIHFAPKRAMASFENLVALANYEEHLREARKIVWRDKGEKPVELEDLWEVAEHAGRGGLRAGGLAFAIRSGVNLILLLARIKRMPRSYRFAAVRHAMFGPDSWRFAALLGTFVSVYKLVLNALPIILPEPKPHYRPTHSHTHSHYRSRATFRSQHPVGSESLAGPSSSPFLEDDTAIDELEQGSRGSKGKFIAIADRNARLSSSAQAHQEWVRKRTRRWYAIVAGALAGAAAIKWEKKGRRVAIAQQMFVRGLQGSFNAFSDRHGIKIPHGDVLVFSLCCAQIMYGFLMRPDTLPRSYVSWIQTASKVPPRCVSMNRDLVRDHAFKIEDIDKLINWKNITPENHAELLARKALATAPNPSYGPYFVPCAGMHPWFNSCIPTGLERFFVVFKWMLPIYGALHFIPMLLFKRNLVMRDPFKMLRRAGWGTARSSAFLGMFVLIYQSCFCFKHNVWLYLTYLRNRTTRSLLSRVARLLPQPLVDFFISKASLFILGLVTGLSLFVEEKHRRAELAMYVLPKALESAWVMARGKGLVFGTGNYGDMLLTAAGMGMVMSTYQNDPQHLSGLVRRILYQFVGPN